MPDMEEKYSELHPETAQRLADVLNKQEREAFSFLSDLGKRLTNTNFLTNGGGAVATLAFLGTGADIPALKIALLIFTAGVIATGIELRALLKYWGELGADANRRLRGFLTNELTVEQCHKVESGVGKKSKTVNDIAGKASQILFVVGVLVGAVGFL